MKLDLHSFLKKIIDNGHTIGCNAIKYENSSLPFIEEKDCDCHVIEAKQLLKDLFDDKNL